MRVIMMKSNLFVTPLTFLFLDLQMMTIMTMMEKRRHTNKTKEENMYTKHSVPFPSQKLKASMMKSYQKDE